jgi:hypothetical protein
MQCRLPWSRHIAPQPVHDARERWWRAMARISTHKTRVLIGSQTCPHTNTPAEHAAKNSRRSSHSATPRLRSVQNVAANSARYSAVLASPLREAASIRTTVDRRVQVQSPAPQLQFQTLAKQLQQLLAQRRNQVSPLPQLLRQRRQRRQPRLRVPKHHSSQYRLLRD